MVVIELKAPKEYEKYIENPEFNSIISDLFVDYIEKKQDQELAVNLSNDDNFLELNNLIEKKLGN